MIVNSIGKLVRYIGFLVRIIVVISLAALSPANMVNAETLDIMVGFKPYLVTENPTKVVPPEIEEETLSEEEKTERAKKIDAYYEKRNMPLAGYGKKFVEVAEKCEIDYRLLPAIGVRESSGGKFQFNNNPFGWGSAKIKFKDFGEAIEKVSDHLCGFMPNTARYYKDKTTYEKLWYYNGTVIRTYPKEVMDIMDMM